MIIRRHSPITGTIFEWDLPVTQEMLDRWQAGELIQSVMPHLTKDQREFIKTGMSPKDWDVLWHEDDENDEKERNPINWPNHKRRNPDREIRELERRWRQSRDPDDFQRWFTALDRAKDPEAEKYRCANCNEGFVDLVHPRYNCHFCPTKVCEECQHSRDPDLLISWCRTCEESVCTPWVSDLACGVPYYDSQATHGGGDHPYFLCRDCNALGWIGG